MKFKLEQKFPCGYEQNYDIRGLLLRDFSDLKLLSECPLHGKKCANCEESE